MTTRNESAEIDRLAKIDPREVYREIGEDTFCDSDEWLERRSYEWELNIVTEKQSGKCRKEK
jgi:hypothetical protein